MAFPPTPDEAKALVRGVVARLESLGTAAHVPDQEELAAMFVLLDHILNDREKT